jgi:hypothetical protein
MQAGDNARGTPMARSNRPKPDDPMQLCFGIRPHTFEVIRILATRDGSYSIGGHSYSNQHSLPIEHEVAIKHGITDIICVLMHQINDTKGNEDMLKEKAAKMKVEAAR